MRRFALFALCFGCQGEPATLAELDAARQGAIDRDDILRAEQIDVRLCDRGQRKACEAVLPRVEEAARPALEARVCALGNSDVCWSLGTRRMWDDHDSDAALAAWDLGCSAGHAPSCLAVGDLFRAHQDLTGAIQRFELACQASSAAGCASQEVAETRRTASASCAETGQLSCVEACDPMAKGGATCDRALELQREACAHGEAQACTWAGRALSQGWVEETDIVAAQDLLWRGCDLDDAWGCLQLVTNIESGLGQNPSPKDLAWLRNQVCDLQLDYGCSVSWTATP